MARTPEQKIPSQNPSSNQTVLNNTAKKKNPDNDNAHVVPIASKSHVSIVELQQTRVKDISTSKNVNSVQHVAVVQQVARVPIAPPRFDPNVYINKLKQATNLEYQSGLKNLEDMAIHNRTIIWVLDPFKKKNEAQKFLEKSSFVHIEDKNGSLLPYSIGKLVIDPEKDKYIFKGTRPKGLDIHNEYISGIKAEVYKWSKDEVLFCCLGDIPHIDCYYNESEDPLWENEWSVTECPYAAENTRMNNLNNIQRLSDMTGIIKDIIILNADVKKNVSIYPNIDRRLILEHLNAK